MEVVSGCSEEGDGPNEGDGSPVESEWLAINSTEQLELFMVSHRWYCTPSLVPRPLPAFNYYSHKH